VSKASVRGYDLTQIVNQYGIKNPSKGSWSPKATREVCLDLLYFESGTGRFDRSANNPKRKRITRVSLLLLEHKETA